MTDQHDGGETTAEVKTQETTASSQNQSLGIPGAIVLGSALISASIYFGLAGVGGGFLATNTGNDTVAGAGNDNVPTQPTQPTQPTEPVDVEPGDLPLLGDPDAPVLVVEWSDYQCPFCKRAFDDAFTKIREEYVDSGQVAIAYRDFAFLGAASNVGANAARCANEQGAFWEFHDELWAQHPGSGHGEHLTAENLKTIGADLGLNTAQFNDCVDTDKYADAVSEDTAAGRNAGVSGTPTTFINGRIVNGAQPFSAFQQIIEDELNN